MGNLYNDSPAPMYHWSKDATERKTMSAPTLLKLDSRRRLNVTKLVPDKSIQDVKATPLGHGRFLIEPIVDVLTPADIAAMKDPYIDDVIQKAIHGELGPEVPRPRHPHKTDSEEY